MTKTTGPRNGSFYGMKISNSLFDDGTWLEGEEFAYPDGGFTRRAFATCEDGQKRILRCSIPDTYFSIPARGKIKGVYVTGFLSNNSENTGLKFTRTNS